MWKLTEYIRLRLDLNVINVIVVGDEHVLEVQTNSNMQRN